MMQCIRSSGTKWSMSAFRLLALGFLFISTAGWSLDASSPAYDKAVAARVKRDTVRCERRRNVDACNDAIRRNPGDPALLVALADALVRAKRPADAIRNYRRAAALAPNMPDLAAKISAAEKRSESEQSPSVVRRTVQSAPRARAESHVARSAPNIEPEKRYSNAEPETQSH